MTAALGMPAAAAPVERGDLPSTPDPYELAMRWTSLSLALAPALPGHLAPPAATPMPTRFNPLPHGSGDHGVPDPGAYALMGLALLVAGLVARRITSARRASRRPGQAF